MTQDAKHLYSKYKYIWAQCHNTMDSLFTFIQQYPYIQMDKYGNVTVRNTNEVDNTPAFCCHLDTVHHDFPYPELLGGDVLTSFNGHGIGGDDKCGIVACLELLQRVPCKAIFFRDEEKGCLGSREYNTEQLKNNLFCIEIDRRNATDLITKTGGIDMCSKEFVTRIKAIMPWCKEADGLFTDVSRLGKAGINMLNISSGYYNPHSAKEYVVLSELSRNIDGLEEFAKDIIKNPLNEKEYTRNEYTTTYTKSYWSTKGTRYKKTNDLYSGTNAGEDDYHSLQWGEREDDTDDYGGYSNDPAESAANREAIEWFRQQEKEKKQSRK